MVSVRAVFHASEFSNGSPITTPQTLDTSSDHPFSRRGVQTAFPFFVGFGGIKVVPLIRQIVLPEIGLHRRVGPVKGRTDLERAEVGILRQDIKAGAVGVLNLTQG